jgi:hypothetical protein
MNQGEPLSDLVQRLREYANARSVNLLHEAVNALVEHELSFDLRWAADMRAIKLWQEKTGKELVWPDHADLVVFLGEKVSRLEARNRELERRLCEIEELVDDLVDINEHGGPNLAMQVHVIVNGQDKP